MAFDIGNLCGCLGPHGTDPYCPCVMRQKGLEPSTPKWTEEDDKRLSLALDKLRERAKS